MCFKRDGRRRLPRGRRAPGYTMIVSAPQERMGSMSGGKWWSIGRHRVLHGIHGKILPSHNPSGELVDSFHYKGKRINASSPRSKQRPIDEGFLQKIISEKTVSEFFDAVFGIWRFVDEGGERDDLDPFSFIWESSLADRLERWPDGDGRFRWPCRWRGKT